MKILVANLGSTSFKYRLFDMSTEQQLARGGIDRIGDSLSHCFVEMNGKRREEEASVADHAVAVKKCLEQLTTGEDACLRDAAEVTAIGFKAVHGGQISGVQRVTPELLAAMEEMNQVAPAHNPPYINAMRLLGEQLPKIPLVAAFETGFHATVPERLKTYGCPFSWGSELGVKRWGFHGASHRFIAQRTSVLLGRSDLRVISCHLGGSSSLCAIRAGKSVATSMGMSPQTGLPHNNRVGDFDPFALPLIMRATGQTLDEVLAQLANQGGLLGISGVSGDIRDLEAAAAEGNTRAELALSVYTSEIRRYLGGLLVELGGADAIIFTGGIGENGASIRAATCAGLSELGIALDNKANSNAAGECRIDSGKHQVQIWIVPANEELVVAQQTMQLLNENS